jgi:hypothetical protein
MKGTLKTTMDGFLIALENGADIKSDEGETREDFIEGAKEMVQNEYMEELEIDEPAEAPVKKPATKAKAKAKAKPKTSPKNVVDDLSGDDDDEEIESALAEVTEKKVAKPRVKKDPVTEEQLVEYRAKFNGKLITFAPNGEAAPLEGICRQVIIDKRVNAAYLQINVVDENGKKKLKHKSVTATFEVSEAPIPTDVVRSSKAKGKIDEANEESVEDALA